LSTTHNLSSKFLYGRAFRAPSFSELFAQNNDSLIGNPNLEPETIDTYEVAFDYRPSYDIDLKLNLFLYQIKDLVEIQFGSQASNALEQSGQGFEFEMVWRATEQLKFVGNYALQKAEDDDSEADVPNAPQQQLYIRSIWA
jgi:iron complex outermembrane receptor protein